MQTKEFIPKILCFSARFESLWRLGQMRAEMFHVIVVHVEFGFERHSPSVSVLLSGRLLESPGF
jgi:hypothetical protein